MAVVRRTTNAGTIRYAAKWRDTTGKWHEKWFPTKQAARRYDEARKLTDTPTASMTVNELSDIWIEQHVRQLSQRTLRFYETQVEQRIRNSGIGNRQVGMLTPLAITQWQRDTAQNHSPTATNQSLRALKAMLQKAVQWGIIPANPATPVKRIRVEQSHVGIALTSEQVDALANSADTLRDSTLVRVAAYTGMRLSEMCALKWSDITESHIHIRRAVNEDGSIKPTKSYENRRVPLFAKTSTAIAEWHHAVGDTTIEWVFPAVSGIPMRPDTLSKTFMKIARTAGISCTFHDLRRTFTSTLVEQNVDIRTAQTWLGHSDPSTTLRHYARQRADETAIVALIDAAL